MHKDIIDKDRIGKHAVYICFDCDHDQKMRNALAYEARRLNSPFYISGSSEKGNFSPKWHKRLGWKLGHSDQVCVLCGEHTDTDFVVNRELQIAQEMGKPYFLLAAGMFTYKRPRVARDTDKLYRWRWENLRGLVAGLR